jgi:hypothetical protein
MPKNTKESNTFAKMKAEQTEDIEEIQTPSTQPVKAKTEFSIDDLSATPVGENIKYTRPDLNGKEDVVASFVIEPADTEEQPTASRNGESEYWKTTCILYYESKNADGVQNREYISGARQFVQKDGSASSPSFWYKDATKQSQIGYLWELVAKAKKIEPDQLSPREFYAFLNNKPKVKIVAKEYDNYNAPRGSPATVKKNMPGAFI